MSNSLLCPAHLTSTTHATRAADRRQLNESGIKRALELTVSTIIESEDSEFSIAEATAVGWRSDTRPETCIIPPHSTCDIMITTAPRDFWFFALQRGRVARDGIICCNHSFIEFLSVIRV